MKQRTWYQLLCLAFFVLFACGGLFAQQNSEISGTVADKQGAAIPGAHVVLTELGTGYTSSVDTNGAGIFTFPGLNIGTYSLKVTAKGFQSTVQRGMQLNVSQTLRSDVSLAVGSVNETVTVEANALVVQADSNVVSTLISAQQMSQIATQNRNFAALAALGLGVSSGLPDNNTPTSVASNFTLSVNGLRQSHNIWLIDGGEADDRGGAGGMSIMPSQDAIAQFEMLSSNYPPDYGISSGATMSLALKSGTQTFHGGIWEFNRNTAYNANNYFNNQSGQPRQKLNYNIYGFNIGGPVMIPHVYNTNRSKTFFFWNEEWRKIIQGSSPNVVNTLPDKDFPTAGADLPYVSPLYAKAPITLTVPNTVNDPAFLAKLAAAGLTPGSPMPVIPASLFDPNALLYFNTGIIPHSNNGNDQIVSSANQPINVRDDVVRIDHRVTDKWQILGHYIHDSVLQSYAQPMLGWSAGNYNTITSELSNPSNSAAIKLTGTIAPTLLVEASLNYDGNVINITNSPNSQVPSGWTAANFFANGSKNVPGMSWSAPYNVSEEPGSAPWHNAAQDFEPKVDVSYLNGKHAMKFGFSYNRYTKNQQLFGDPGGQYNWNTLTGDSMMDFLLGLAGSYNQAAQLPINHYVNQTTSVYAMDNWHVTPNLSLQLGIRYDALPHAWERNNNLSNFDPNQYLQSARPEYIGTSGQLNPAGPGFATPPGAAGPFYLNGIYLAGQNGYPKGLVTNDYNSIQPRFGFSDDIFGNGKAVLRGGFGTFYERLQGNDVYNAATTAPFFSDPSASNVYFSNPHTVWTDGSTATSPVFAQGMTTLARSYPPPAVAQFSLGVQYEVAPSVIAVVQYVGNLAWHQNIERNINNYPVDTSMAIRANSGDPNNHYPGIACDTTLPSSPTNCPNTNLVNPDQYRTFQGYTGITQQENTTNGNYNGFQAGLRAQNKHGLSGELDYTWSHEIDVTSYDLDQVSNPLNLKYDKGSGALDRRQILQANYVYNLPIFTSGSGFAHSLLGGWTIAGTAVFNSGAIISNQGTGLSLNYDPVGLDGGYTNRPDVVSKIHYTKTVKEWFDTSSFAAPTPAWAGGLNQGFGNARKDTVIGPGRINFSTSLYKAFAITERAKFELRFETYNTFNHAEFNGVGNGFGNGNFGQVTSTFDPRTLELGGRFEF